MARRELTRAEAEERAALVGYLRRLLNQFDDREAPWGEDALAKASAEEIERLVGVTMAVISQEATGQ